MNVTEKQYWHYSFMQNGGDERFLFNFDLNQNSTVFDIGSFDGDYFKTLYKKYNCTIHAFEPVLSFYEGSKGSIPDRVKVNNYALGKGDDSFIIHLAGNASSAFSEGGEKVECKKVDFNTYIKVNGINQIDLLKVNCEGGEYELLETIIENSWLSNIDNIIIQFHILPGIPIERRQRIVDEIQKTHQITFSFPFVWEGWKKK